MQQSCFVIAFFGTMKGKKVTITVVARANEAAGTTVAATAKQRLFSSMEGSQTRTGQVADCRTANAFF